MLVSKAASNPKIRNFLNYSTLAIKEESNGSSRRMKIALLGTGKMGSLIQSTALQQNHQIISQASTSDLLDLENADVCIDFSHASQVPKIVQKCILLKKPIVIGSTGWNTISDQIKKEIQASGIGCVASANFSIGIFLVEHLTKSLATLLKQTPEYEIAIEETHHTKKVDSPSGTALQLASHFDPIKPNISSIRSGTTPGIHTLTLDSATDTIELKHSAKNRNGFAIGALQAAEWIRFKKGFYTFQEMLKDVYAL